MKSSHLSFAPKKMMFKILISEKRCLNLLPKAENVVSKFIQNSTERELKCLHVYIYFPIFLSIAIESERSNLNYNIDVSKLDEILNEILYSVFHTLISFYETDYKMSN